jgi:hypothetical protein
MLGLSPWFSFAAVGSAALLAWLLVRGGVDTSPVARAGQAALEHRWAPIAVGVLTSLIVVAVWGGLARTPVIHDEASYLLQAELFARGAWTAPRPSLPEFFEQQYVLVTPVLASKYPPGHALMLAPGALIGLPGLPVVLMNGVSGALIFALASRAAGGLVALVTWVVWVTCFPAIYFRATYLSEVTSGAAWLVGWWCLMRWSESDRRGWLIGLVASVALVAITRPLTAIAFGLPIALVVLRSVAEQRRWRELGLAVAIGAVGAALIPVWSARTTGSPLLTPLELYTRMYMPFDGPGFGVDSTVRPARQVPRDMAITNASFREEHRRHTVATLPRTFGKRARMIARDMWYDWRLGLAPFALVALPLMPAIAWFALATLILHVLLYLLYAHPPFWTVYYLESEPILAFGTAVGVVWVVGRAARSARAGNGAERTATFVPVVALVLAACVPGTMTLRLLRRQVDRDHAYFERFEALVRRIPDERAIVFVRYAPAHNDNLSLVRNSSGHEDARFWIVHDRGADNARLMVSAPNRRPYIFDEASWSLRPLDSPSWVKTVADP